MPFDHLTASPHAFIAELHAARAELDAEWDAIDDTTMDQPGMTGEWSGRETLAHIARWDETTTLMTLRDRHGVLPGVNEYDDYEQWNLWWADVDRTISLDNARQRYASAREALIRTLTALDEDDWTPLVRGWVNEACLRHDMHHRDTLRRWKAARTTT